MIKVTSHFNLDQTNFSQEPLNTTQEITQKILEILQANQSFNSRDKWVKDFVNIKPDQLQRILEDVCQELADSKDPIKTMNILAEILPLEKLQEAVRQKYPNHIDAIHTAKEMFEEAKYFLQISEKTLSPSLFTRLSAILSYLLSVLENIIAAFGVADLFKPSDSAMHAEFKGHKIMLLLSIFSILSAILIPLVGPSLGGLIIGGTLLFIAALSLIYPYFKPMPSNLPKAENWTEQLKQGNLFVVEGRKKILDRIARILLSNKGVKTHPLLIGKTGVGKTETAKAFVQAISRGDYPELKGKQVFYFNTANLVNYVEMFGNGNNIIANIKEALGRHSKNVILIFDEIHLACQKKEHSAIGEQLQALLDPGTSNFPYVIGITTEEEYYRDIYVNHPAFARRFKEVPIENTTPEETDEILNNALLQQAPNIILDTGVSDYLLKKTVEAFSANAPQPATSLKILSKCIQLTSQTQKSALEEKIEDTREKLRFLYTQGSVGQGDSLLPYLAQERRDKIKQLEEELEGLQEKLEFEIEALTHLFQKRDELGAMKTKTLRTASKIAKLQEDNLSKNDNRKLNAFLLISHFLAPAMETLIRKKAEHLGVNTVIGSNLIDQVILDELENRKKVQEAIEQGKKQMQERLNENKIDETEHFNKKEFDTDSRILLAE